MSGLSQVITATEMNPEQGVYMCIVGNIVADLG